LRNNAAIALASIDGFGSVVVCRYAPLPTTKATRRSALAG